MQILDKGDRIKCIPGSPQERHELINYLRKAIGRSHGKDSGWWPYKRNIIVTGRNPDQIIQLKMMWG